MDSKTVYNSYSKLNTNLLNSEQLERNNLGDKYNPNYSSSDLLKGGKSGILDISDPLFTSFTIMFDFIGSPLLVNTVEYINKLNNSTDSDKSLAGVIEQNLKTTAEDVENGSINTLEVFSNSSYNYVTTRAGYSAVDYTYMIDKACSEQSVDNLNESVGNINNRQKQGSEYQNQIDEKNNKKSELNEKINNLQIEINKLKKDNKSNDPKVRINQIEIDRLQKVIKSLDDEINDLNKTKDDEINKENQVTQESIDKTQQTTEDNQNIFPAPSTTIELVKFGSGLKILSEEYPYIFQTIDGLDTAYSNYYKTDVNLKSSGDEKISITCLESVDMRVSTLFNRYLHSAYDRTWKRDRLPINLRKFNCSVFVHDSRSFLNFYTKMGQSLLSVLNNAEQLSPEQQLALSHLSTAVFNFYECEIVPEETANIFDSISNEDSQNKQTKFTFKYNDVKIDYVNFLDVLTNSDTNNTFISTYNKSLGSQEKELYSSATNESANKNLNGDLSVGSNIYGSVSGGRNILSDFVRQGIGLLKMTGQNLLNENVYDESLLSDAKRLLTSLSTTNPGTSIMQGLIGRGVQALAKDNQKTLGDMTKDLINGNTKYIPNSSTSIKDLGNVND